MQAIQNAYQIIFEKVSEWVKGFIALIPNIFVAILVIIAFYFLAKYSRKLYKRSVGRVSSNNALNQLLGNIIFTIVIALGVMIALNILQLSKAVVSILAGVGIIGLALGFAFQDIAANFISGIGLAIRKKYPFQEKDIIEIDGIQGTVEKIGLRDSMLKTFDGLHVFIPNKMIFDNKVTNYSLSGMRRVQLGVGVSYSDDLEKVEKLTIDTIKKLKIHKKNKPIQLWYEEFGDSSINFSVRFWIDYKTSNKDYKSAVHNTIIAIKKAFDKEGITIPFPIRTLDFELSSQNKLHLGK